MTEFTMRISEEEDRMNTAIRAHFGLSNRTATIRYLIREKYREITAPAARPRKAAPPPAASNDDEGWE